MPVYSCSRGGAVENTATGDYWTQQLEATHTPGKGFKPLCSECLTGKWHGSFPKQQAAGRYEKGADGFLQPPGGWKAARR